MTSEMKTKIRVEEADAIHPPDAVDKYGIIIIFLLYYTVFIKPFLNFQYNRIVLWVKFSLRI